MKCDSLGLAVATLVELSTYIFRRYFQWENWDREQWKLNLHQSIKLSHTRLENKIISMINTNSKYLINLPIQIRKTSWKLQSENQQQIEFKFSFSFLFLDRAGVIVSRDCHFEVVGQKENVCTVTHSRQVESCYTCKGDLCNASSAGRFVAMTSAALLALFALQMALWEAAAHWIFIIIQCTIFKNIIFLFNVKINCKNSFN